MDLCRLALAIHRSPTQQAAFAEFTRVLGDELPLRCAVWVGEDPALRLCVHPADAEVPDELGTMALHVGRPEVFPVAALSPTAGARYPDAEALLLPLGHTHAGALLLVADAGAFGEDLAAWDEAAAALGLAATRERLLREAREERESYRKRAQEMEALDVLGLAANQSLDPQEVVSLVARFARTLLGAHYSMVQTVEEGALRSPAAVGLHPTPVQPDGDPFARRVIHAQKPVVLGQGGAEITQDAYPLHHAQGMQVGLGVPLTMFGETLGALVVGYRDAYPVTARDTLLALTLARHAAVAINNARLHAALADRSEELQRANEELHRTSQLKERFFAAMSHELRTPVNGILGRQNLVLEGISGPVPAAVRTQLEKANASARTLLHLVDEILDYARLEAGKMAVNLLDVPVAGVVAEALATVETQAAAKGIALQADLDQATAAVRTDPDRTRQIVLNLLSNAVKFTERGAVTVSAAPVGDAGGVRWMELRVRDTGPGIARADQERIFLEFEQVGGTRGGTGLGLPISRRLALLLGGDLRVESEPGAGSTFILRLPLAAPRPASPPRPRRASSSTRDDLPHAQAT
ncbi:MAG: GAF domain-containing sensor histidine kinase [Gemmatimonadetes bacterium]|nr:GAF domain-containing sensor histidine kinase [Gemmatimonadota bacterium]